MYWRFLSFRTELRNGLLFPGAKDTSAANLLLKNGLRTGGGFHVATGRSVCLVLTVFFRDKPSLVRNKVFFT